MSLILRFSFVTSGMYQPVELGIVQAFAPICANGIKALTRVLRPPPPPNFAVFTISDIAIIAASTGIFCYIMVLNALLIPKLPNSFCICFTCLNQSELKALDAFSKPGINSSKNSTSVLGSNRVSLPPGKFLSAHLINYFSLLYSC